MTRRLAALGALAGALACQPISGEEEGPENVDLGRSGAEAGPPPGGDASTPDAVRPTPSGDAGALPGDASTQPSRDAAVSPSADAGPTPAVDAALPVPDAALPDADAALPDAEVEPPQPSMNPLAVDCVDAVPGRWCFLRGDFTEPVYTMTADTTWVLQGQVSFGDDENETRLTIEAGTTILGAPEDPARLVVRRASRLVAEGRPDAPIVFSSSSPADVRGRGDWGGAVLHGRAPINACPRGNPECEAEAPTESGVYGGALPDDDSGTLRYVRIEFAGAAIGPDTHLNGLTLNGVGRGTRIEHVHVHASGDDGVEVYGGTVDLRHVFVSGAADDGLAWHQGWVGRGQFLVVQGYGDVADNALEGESDSGDHEALPRSNPTLSQVTLVGGAAPSSGDAVLLRRGTAGALSSLLVVGWDEGLVVTDESTVAQIRASALRIDHTTLDGATLPGGATRVGGAVEMWNAGTANLLGATTLLLPPDRQNPALAPIPGRPPAVTGATPDDPFFTPAAFRGGIDPEADWIAAGLLEGWIALEPVSN